MLSGLCIILHFSSCSKKPLRIARWTIVLNPSLPEVSVHSTWEAKGSLSSRAISSVTCVAAKAQRTNGYTVAFLTWLFLFAHIWGWLLWRSGFFIVPPLLHFSLKKKMIRKHKRIVPHCFHSKKKGFLRTLICTAHIFFSFYVRKCFFSCRTGRE